MKKLFFLCIWGILLLLPSISLTAQTQISENYLITGPWTDYVAPMKYSYTVSDEGERVMNGPISISGKQNETYGNVTITGSYVLNASAKNGNLNGAMSVKANYHGVKQLFRGQEVEDYAYSFSGNFINGVPNGTFTAKATNFGSSSVTYKQGVLVGAYSVDEVTNDRILTIKGSFNDAGKMVGVWDIKKFGDTEVWEFQNGVRIRLSSKQSESTPKQIEMAKRFASGSITKEALEEEGYFPVQDSIALGDYANDLYFLKFIADWDKMPDCSFGKAKWVKYSYLYNLLPLPAREFESVLSNYKENGKAPLPVSFDEIAQCYVTNYWENYGTPQSKLIQGRRFTESQLKAIEEAVDGYCRQHPISLSDLFYVSNVYFGITDKARNIDNRFEQLKEETSLSSAYSTHKSLIKDFEEVSETLKKIMDGKTMTPDGLFYIIPGEQPLTVHYYSASSLENYYALEQEVKNYKSVIDQRAEEERIAKEKKAEEERIAKEKAKEERRSAVAQYFISGLSGIEKQSANKTSEILNRLAVKMGYGYYDRVPKNPLNVTITELAEAIAPVIEYNVVDIIEEESGGYDTYKITIEFKKKKETVPVSMSITNNGKIIEGNIAIPEDILNTARKSAKNKQAVSNFLRL